MEPPRTGVGEIPQEDPRTRPGTASRAADKLQPESRPKLTTLRGALSPSAEADSIPGTPRKPERSPHNNRALFRNSPFSLSPFSRSFPPPVAISRRCQRPPRRYSRCSGARRVRGAPRCLRAAGPGTRRQSRAEAGGSPRLFAAPRRSAQQCLGARCRSPPHSPHLLSPPTLGRVFVFVMQTAALLSLGLKAVPEAARPGCAPLRSAHAARPAPPRAPRPPSAL